MAAFAADDAEDWEIIPNTPDESSSSSTSTSISPTPPATEQPIVNQVVKLSTGEQPRDANISAIFTIPRNTVTVANLTRRARALLRQREAAAGGGSGPEPGAGPNIRLLVPYVPTIITVDSDLQRACAQCRARGRQDGVLRVVASWARPKLVVPSMPCMRQASQ